MKRYLRKLLRQNMPIRYILSILMFSVIGLTANAQCPPTITATPAIASVCAGDSVQLDCTPSTGTTWQWYVDGNPIPGATNSTYYALTNGNYTVMTGGCATASVVPIAVSIKPIPAISITSSAATVCYGEQVTFTINAGANVNWIWLQAPGYQYTSVNPITVILTTTTVIQVVGVDQTTNCANTATITIPVAPILMPGSIMSDAQVCFGGVPPLITGTPASGGGGTYTYQWEISTTSAGAGYSDIAGANGLNYQPGFITQTTWFRRRVSSPPCPDEYSNVVVVTVNTSPVVISSANKNICSGTSVAYTPTANIAGSTFSWTGSVTSGTVSGVSASGNGNINDILTLPAGSSTTGTVTYIITPIGPAPTFCAGTPFNLVVIVYPTPTITNASLTQDICAGATTVPVIWQSNVANTTFTWIVSGSAGLSGYQAFGSGNLPAMQIFSSLLVVGTVTYTVTPHGPAPTSCNGPSVNYVINVNPSPSVTNNPMQQTICSGDNTTAVTLTSNIGSTTFTWTATATPAGVSGFQASGTNTIPVQTITNTSAVQGIVTYNVVPSGSFNGCPGIPRDYYVYVNPIPVATATPSVDEICSGQTTNIALTSSVPNTTFTWTASAPGSLTGLSNGSGNTIAQTISNTSNAPHDVTYVVTPTSLGCIGAPITVIVTVNPYNQITTPPSTQTICSGNSFTINLNATLPTTVFSWTASGAGVTGYSNGSGSTISQTLTNITATPKNVVYNVTGTNNGCTTSTTTFTIVVNPAPVLTNNPLTATRCSGVAFNLALTSNIAGATFTWIANGTPGISGLSGGSGLTINQTLINSTNSAGTVTYTITPIANGCNGTPVDFVLTVNPIPDVILSLSNQSICSGTATTAVTFSSGVSGTIYNWTATPSGAGITGYTASGNAIIASQIINNSLAAQGTVTYHVTPSNSGCAGTIQNHVVMINPLPLVTNTPMTQTICSGALTSNVNLLSNVAGTTFTWIATPSSPAITGYQPSGFGTIPPQTLLNSSLTPGTVTYQIIPTSNFGPACQGTAANYIITVNPIPSVTSSLMEAVCSNQPFSYTITSDVAGSTFAWSRAAVAGISNPASSGTNSTFSETLINLTPTDIVVTYVLTPIGSAPTSCTGTSVNLAVTVRALPVVNAGSDLTIPFGTNTTITGTTSGGTGTPTYTWTPNAYIASGANTLVPQTINLNATRTFTLGVTDAAGCISSDNMTVFITGSALASVPTANPASVCFGQSSILNANATGGSGTYTYSWTSNPAGFTSNSSTPSVSPVVNTVYTVIVNDGFNTVTSSVSVSVNPLPVQYALTGGGSYCNGGVGVNVGIAGSQSGVSYQLFNNGNPVGSAIIGNGGSLSFGNQTLAGTYTVDGTRVSTGCSLDMGSSVLVSINALPIANAGIDQIIPFGTSTSLNGSASGGTGTITYSWTPLASIGVGANTPTPSTTNIYSNTTFSLTVTDGNNCSGSDQMSVSLNGSAITVVASATPNQICADTSQTQLQAIVSGGSGTYSFSWTCVPAGSPVWTSSQQNPWVSPDVTTTYSVTANDGFNTAIASATIVVNPLPLVYSVIGGGSYCFGSTGVNIGLSGSETGVDYQLYRGGAPDGPAVTGTGNPISFGNRTAAFTYTVLATNNTTGCINLMTGSSTVSIIPPPSAYLVTGGGSYPFGGPGRTIGLNHGDAGISYQLYCNNVAVGIPVTGTETAVNFGLQTQAGTYTVIATDLVTGCTADMTGSVNIIILPLPLAFEVIGGGEFCAGQPGLPVGTTGSETGVDYQLLFNGFPHGALQSGTNFPLTWGPFVVAGLYEVRAINATNGASQMMKDSAVIIVNPLPTIFTLNPTGPQCPGTIIRLNGSEAGLQYYLLFNGITIDSITGTGVVGFLDFGPQTNNGTYTIKAVNPVTGCEALMNGSTFINVSPQVFNVIPAGILCPGQVISITGSEIGVNYQLRWNGTFDFGPPVPGTGSALALGTVGLPGVYTAVAIDATTNCVSFMNGSATLYPDPTAFTIVPDGPACEGDIVSMNGSQLGVNYVLILDNAIYLDTISGTGLPISFGPQLTEGNYTILAIDQTSYCQFPMNGTAVLNDSPIKYSLLPAGLQCINTTIGLSGSQIGVSYQLILNGVFNMGSPVAGTGAAISFGPQSLTGIYTVRAVNSTTGCNSMMSDSTTLEALPTMYLVTPTGNNCAGTNITLGGSDLNFSYILVFNGSVNLDTIAGTGGVLNFGAQTTTGTYTVVAYNAITFCSAPMNGNTIIDAAPLIFNITPSGIACVNQIIGLDNSELNVSYQLRRNGTINIGVPVSGTGLPISFGIQSLPGIYTVEAAGSNGCPATMNGNVILNSSPITFTQFPAGNNCPGTIITINGSEISANYILYRDGIFAVDTLTGTGSSLSFGAQFIAGTYTTTAYSTATLCPAVLTGSTVIIPGPTVYNVTPAGNICAGSTIGTDGSEIGVNYQLRRDGITNVGGPMAGTGSALSFGIVNNPGTYSIIATSTMNGCASVMNGNAVLQPLPLSFAIIQQGTQCAGTSIALNGSQLGTDYVLVLDNIFNLDTIAGTGNVLDFGPQLTTGTYTIVAIGGTTTCQATMTGIVQIVANPTNFNLTPAGLICESTVVGLDGSEVGIDYTLYKNGMSTGITVSGTGNAISFGTQTFGNYTVKAVNQTTTCSIFMSATMVISSPPLVNAGSDVTICANQTERLNGTATNSGTPTWTTSGNGSFDDINNLNATYTLGSSEISAGSVWLILTANGTGICSSLQVIDSLLVTIDQLATANAGGDLDVCNPIDYTLNGATATNYNSVNWNTSGSGSFVNGNSLTPTYSPSAADLALGSVILTLNVTGNSPCSNSVTDDVVMTFHPKVTANAGPDATICSDNSFTFSSATASNNQSVTWSSTSTGTFTNGNSLTATYTPSAADQTAGSVKLILTALSLAPCSVTVSDTMKLTLTPAPISNAGADVSICENTSLIITDASVSNSTSIIWSTSGTGSFSNPGFINPVYTPSATDITSGSVVLTLTVTGDAICAPALDQKIITFVLNPLVNAGNDTHICTTPFTLSGATAANCTSVLWTIQSGSGILTNATTLTPTYTASAADVANGSVVLRLSGTPASPCVTIATDDITLIIDQIPAVNAGPDAASCDNTTFTVSDATATNFSNLIWTATGTGTLFNASTLNPTYNPSAADLAFGSVTLTLTVSNSGCGVVSDTKTISFNNHISVNAGPDLSICEGNTVSIGGASASSYSSVFWSTTGSGAFTNGNTILPIYSPSPADIASGSVTITLNAVSIAPCNNVITDQLVLSIKAKPVLSAGADAFICSTEVYLNNDASALNSSTLTWTASGTGSFDNPNNLTNIYTPDAADIALGSITLTLTTSNNAPCADISDQKVITIQKAPVVNAGPSTTICNTCTFNATGASALNTSAVQWLSSGSGTFNNIASLNPIYTPSTADYANGSVILSLIGFGSPACTQVVDTMMLKFSNSPGVGFTWGPACEGLAVTFSVDPAVTNIGSIVSWNWNFGDGNTSVLMNPVHLFAALGEYNVTLTVVDVNGSAMVVMHKVTVTQVPVSFFSHSTPGCSNEPVLFNDLAHTLYGYIAEWIWNYGDGTNNDTIHFPDDPNTSHLFAGPGTYNVTLSITNSFGCMASVTLPVEVIEAPIANFQYTNDCSGLITSFQDASYANGPGNTVQYYWNFGDPVSGGNNTSDLKDPTHLFSAPGIYQVMHVVRNFNNCADTIVKSVTILEPIAVDFTYDHTCVNGIANFNPNAAVMDTASITTWLWDFGDGVTDFHKNTNHVYAGPGSYQVTLTVTNNSGCTASKIRTVVVNPLPVAMFNFPQLPCEQSSLLFDDASTTYAGHIVRWNWDFGDGNTQVVLFPENPDVNHTYAAAGSYNIKLTIISSDSCTDEQNQVIIINPAPTVNFEFESACENSPVQFNDMTQIGGTGIINGWLWNFGDDISNFNNTSTLQNPLHTYATAGSYQITLTVSTTNGCSSTLVKTITISASPFIDFNFDSHCVSSEIQFNPTAGVNIPSIANWFWSFGDGINSGLSNPVHIYNTPGTYTVTLTITNNSGCHNTISHNITILEAPISNFTSSSPACAKHTVFFTNQSIAPVGHIVRWEYNFGDGGSTIIKFPANPNVSHTYPLYGNYTVNLTVVTNDSCSSTSSHSVQILQSPVANFANTGTCSGSPVQFTDLSQGNPVSWAWNFGDSGSGSSNTSSLQNPTHNFQQGGNYQVSLLVLNSNGCQDTISRTITISAKPVVDFSFNNGCAVDTVQFMSSTFVNVATTSSWLWQFGDNTTSTLVDPIHIYSTPGYYDVTLTITNLNGCTNLKTRQVHVTTAPVALFTSTAPSCSGTAVHFTNISSTPNGIINVWNWNFGDGNQTSVNAPANPNVTHTYTTAGVYDVVLTIHTSTGCEASYTTTVTINDTPTSAFSFAGNCAGSLTSFTDNSQSAGGNQIVGWSWNFGDEFSGINNISALQNPQHTFSSAGTYIVTLTSENSAGCTNTITQTITINPKPAVNFIVSAACVETPVTFSADPAVTNIPDVATYLWNFGDGTPTSTLATPEHLFTQPGTYSITLLITNIAGCQNSISHSITVHALPVAQFATTGNCTNNLVNFTDHSYNPDGEEIVGWSWDFGVTTETGDTSVLQNPMFVYSTAGTYNVTLTITSKSGCTDVVVIPVNVIPGPSSAYSYIAEPCHNGSVLFTDESTSNQSIITSWYWEFAPGMYSTLRNPVHVFGQTDTCYNVKLVVTTENGCTDTIIKEVCIPTGLKVTFDYTQTCFGELTWFNPTLVQPVGDEITFYNWNFGDPASGIYNTSIVANPSHTFSKPGTFVVSLQATDANSCSTLIYKTIKVDPLPIAAFSNSGGNCDSLVEFKNLTTAAPIAQWIWNFGDGEGDTITAPSNPDVTHIYPYPGQFNVTLITQSIAGCSDTITQTIRRTPCMAANFNVTDTVICQKRSMHFSDISTSQAPIASWQWFFGDNSVVTYTSLQPFVEHTYNTAGNYNVKMVISTNMVGGLVTDTAYSQVVVKPAPTAAFKWQDVCIGNSTVFQNMTQPNNTIITSYNWNFNDPRAILDTSILKHPAYTYDISGEYDVTLVVTNTIGCTDTIVNKVNVFAKPIADFTWNSSCETKPVYFTAGTDTTSSAVVKWNWTFSSAGQTLGASTEANCSYNFGQAGIFDAFLKVVDRHGCTDTIRNQVAINSSPVAAFNIVENYDNEQGRIMLSNGTINGTDYFWDFGNGKTSYASNPVTTFDKEGEYSIKLVTWNGQNCADTIIVPYTLLFKGLFVPTALNPGNIDPEVAVFKPKGTNLRYYNIEIYDRWGNILWTSSKLDVKGSPAESWDGTVHGNVLQQDVYFWRIIAQFRDGEYWDGHNVGNNQNLPQTKTGTVTLIR